MGVSGVGIPEWGRRDGPEDRGEATAGRAPGSLRTPARRGGRPVRGPPAPAGCEPVAKPPLADPRAGGDESERPEHGSGVRAVPAPAVALSGTPGILSGPPNREQDPTRKTARKSGRESGRKSGPRESPPRRRSAAAGPREEGRPPSPRRRFEAPPRVPAPPAFASRRATNPEPPAAVSRRHCAFPRAPGGLRPAGSGNAVAVTRPPNGSAALRTGGRAPRPRRPGLGSGIGPKVCPKVCPEGIPRLGEAPGPASDPAEVSPKDGAGGEGRPVFGLARSGLRGGLRPGSGGNGRRGRRRRSTRRGRRPDLLAGKRTGARRRRRCPGRQASVRSEGAAPHPARAPVADRARPLGEKVSREGLEAAEGGFRRPEPFVGGDRPGGHRGPLGRRHRSALRGMSSRRSRRGEVVGEKVVGEKSSGAASAAMRSSPAAAGAERPLERGAIPSAPAAGTPVAAPDPRSRPGFPTPRNLPPPGPPAPASPGAEDPTREQRRPRWLTPRPAPRSGRRRPPPPASPAGLATRSAGPVSFQS